MKFCQKSLVGSLLRKVSPPRRAESGLRQDSTGPMYGSWHRPVELQGLCSQGCPAVAGHCQNQSRQKKQRVTWRNAVHASQCQSQRGPIGNAHSKANWMVLGLGERSCAHGGRSRLSRSRR